MCCGLLAESSLFGRDRVLTAVVQLAVHMLTACTAAHRFLSACVISAASATAAQAAPVVYSAPHDVIDLTVDDDEVSGWSNQRAADTEVASCRELSQPAPVQCKLKSSQQAALPEQGMPHQQGMAPRQAETSAHQAGMLLQPIPRVPNQAVGSEPVRANSVSQAEAASTDRQGMDEGRTPLPLTACALEDLCMLCAYGMDLAALVSCLLSQIDTGSGTVHCLCIEYTAAECGIRGFVHSQLSYFFAPPTFCTCPAVLALRKLPCCPISPEILQRCSQHKGSTAHDTLHTILPPSPPLPFNYPATILLAPSRVACHACLLLIAVASYMSQKHICASML